MSNQRRYGSVFSHFFSAVFGRCLKTVSLPTNQRSTLSPHPHADDHDAWRVYWTARGQSWRTEPEIDVKRQTELTRRCTVVPDIEKEIYPFKGMKLSRPDVEWLLATHENGRGPVDWSDEKQRNRVGLDLRGANLKDVNLSHLPLARLQGGLCWIACLYPENLLNWRAAGMVLKDAKLDQVHLEGAVLGGIHAEWAVLTQAHLEEADLCEAHLEEAILIEAHMKGANLIKVQARKATLNKASLEDAGLIEAHLEGAYLIESSLGGANLTEAHLEGAYLTNAILTKLGDTHQVGPIIVDAHWDQVNLARMKWSQVKSLGDEKRARQRMFNGQVKDKAAQLRGYEEATRASRQLAVALQAQGLNEDAAHFAYRAQVLQKAAFWFQMLQSGINLKRRMWASGAWLFSWFLFLLAGYGYKPLCSFLAYLLVISSFAAAYYLLGLSDVVGPHHVLGPHYLTWYEAIVVSMTAFHGRGFFAGTFQPGDPQAFVAAFEAFVGLIIEVTFIATLTRRLFGQ